MHSCNEVAVVAVAVTVTVTATVISKVTTSYMYFRLRNTSVLASTLYHNWRICCLRLGSDSKLACSKQTLICSFSGFVAIILQR
jgi:hypothetical protein